MDVPRELQVLSMNVQCMQVEWGPNPAEGGLLGAEKVRQRAVGEADHHVDSADGVGEGEVIEDGLVQQVEGHVQAIPHRHE